MTQETFYCEGNLLFHRDHDGKARHLATFGNNADAMVAATALIKLIIVGKQEKRKLTEPVYTYLWAVNGIDTNGVSLKDNTNGAELYLGCHNGLNIDDIRKFAPLLGKDVAVHVYAMDQLQMPTNEVAA